MLQGMSCSPAARAQSLTVAFTKGKRQAAGKSDLQNGRVELIGTALPGFGVQDEPRLPTDQFFCSSWGMLPCPSLAQPTLGLGTQNLGHLDKG